MGHCYSRNASAVKDDNTAASAVAVAEASPAGAVSASEAAPSTSGRQSTPAQSPWLSPYPAGVNPSPARSTPRRILRWPFPPPSPAKPIMAALLRRQGTRKAKEEAAEEGEGREGSLDKNFGFPKNFAAKYELGKEVGRGHFGHTCWARGKKGDLKGQLVAVKIISKAKVFRAMMIMLGSSTNTLSILYRGKGVYILASQTSPEMTSAIAIEDVRREVKMLKALSGHKHMLKYYDAFEDANSVYIVLELCEGGELLDRILSRGGRYTEEDAKSILVQVLTAVAFCHLQGVVHRDLKPENFLFTTKDEDSPLKVIDFGLSDYARPDYRLNDVVGSAYYVAPEVLHRSYNVEADMWSIGVITYILLCGSRPFWARTESGIFRSVLRAVPNFDDSPWPAISVEAKDFVKRLLIKDHRKRMTAVQALTHPWLRDENRPLPLDISIYKFVKSYVCSTPLKRAALKSLSKALSEDELFFLKSQFKLLEPRDDCVSLENFKTALMRNSTDAMQDARVPEVLSLMEPFPSKMDFNEFCAASISIYQIEALQGWDKIATSAFQYFEKEGNRIISVEELAQELNLAPSAYPLIKDWIRSSDGKLSFLGFTKFLHGVTIRTNNTPRRQ